ncbi:arrestin domain-containing protein 3-like [Dreissena polymorpha]|uniref:Arrestin C-terminal-like domain-containing protein n=1 Tax=Dreissena polymorpha TaxID=45954 RepID=A0A9D4I3D7_DREPO|nr:arrestin domain-containing protein 3-like [Dreissena polymorpha]KAH3746680.1 hypothetical protein DPMN_181090 [Dreissena polymorpha]
MASVARLEVCLDNSADGKYVTGQTVRGKLVLVLRRSMKIQGIEIKVKGRCMAEWREIDPNTGEERQLYEQEDYINQKIPILGKELNQSVVNGSDVTPHVEFIDSGTHVHSFEFDLADDIPSSFEGIHGYVRYWIKAKIVGVWGLLDQSGKVEFPVERQLDLNRIPGAMEPAEDEDSCVMCGCCLNQGSISAFMRINRRGFTPGQSIVCDAEVFNGSDVTILSSKIKLYKIITYGDSPMESITREKVTICEIIRGKVKSGRRELYEQEYLVLPTSLHVTSLPGCSLIDVDYVVELKVTSSQERLHIRLPLLVIVGTVPLSGSIDATAPDPAIRAEGQLSINPFIDQDVSMAPPTTNIPPMATELDELYPPISDKNALMSSDNDDDDGSHQSIRDATSPEVEQSVLSIVKREKSFHELYMTKRRPRVVKIKAAIHEGIANEGASFDEEDEL